MSRYRELPVSHSREQDTGLTSCAFYKNTKTLQADTEWTYRPGQQQETARQGQSDGASHHFPFILPVPSGFGG